MPPVVTLTGASVVLEPLQEDHVEGLLHAQGEDRSSYRFTVVPSDEASMRAYVRAALDDATAGRALPFAIRTRRDGRVVGTSRFLELEVWDTDAAVPSVAEIGATWLAASAQRTGVNTEAKLLMLSHAFEAWRVCRVSLKTDARNERSRRAIERIGGRFEGIRRRHVPAVDGGGRDSAYYSILDGEWPEVREALLARLAATPR